MSAVYGPAVAVASFSKGLFTLYAAARCNATQHIQCEHFQVIQCVRLLRYRATRSSNELNKLTEFTLNALRRVASRCGIRCERTLTLITLLTVTSVNATDLRRVFRGSPSGLTVAFTGSIVVNMHLCKAQHKLKISNVTPKQHNMLCLFTLQETNSRPNSRPSRHAEDN